MSRPPAPGGWEGNLPCDLNAEQVTLGAMMLSRDAIADVARVITPEDHYRPAHQLVHEAILDLDGRGQPADAVTVRAWLDAHRDRGRIGDPAYLHTLIAAVPAAANAAWYARIVAGKAQDRRVILAGTRLAQLGAEGTDRDGRLDVAYRALDEAAGRPAADGPLPACELLPAVLDRIEQGRGAGVPSPWADLNALTGGSRPGQLVVVGARPAVGKTTVLACWAAHAAAHGVPALVCTLEESRQEFLERVLSRVARVPLMTLRDGRLDDDGAWDRIAAAHAVMASWPLWVLDDPYQRVGTIRAHLRSLRRDGTPAGVVIVDYIQLMAGEPGRRGGAESRQVEVSEISRGLKLAAKDAGAAVIAGAQLNRGPEHRAGRVPVLSDLRESGSLENDADMVVLLHREDAYEPASPRAGEMDLIVAKHRAGPCATVTVAHRGAFSSADDMAPPAWAPARQLRRNPVLDAEEADQERRERLAAQRGLPG